MHKTSIQNYNHTSWNILAFNLTHPFPLPFQTDLWKQIYFEGTVWQYLDYEEPNGKCIFQITYSCFVPLKAIVFRKDFMVDQKA